MARFARRRRFARWTWRRRLVAALLLALVGPLAPVACFRFVDPPASAFMLRDGVQRLVAGKPWIAHDWVDYEAIAPAMRLAVVAAEDQRFPTHDGFDFEAIERAVSHNKQSERKRGASTISQQVAKNLFLWPQRSWLRKGFEVYLTVALETFWPKRRILEVYLNIAELGDGVYGVGAASQKFFGRAPSRLSAAQAATLAAVLPSPRKMRARSPGPYTQRRARWIQGQMLQLGSGYLAEL
ncbi:MAG TPA: monofunctional biosynthetic peptidoglycan transglycosylase [Myxococcota bacterium]